jgi:hypothetical protein
MSLCKQRARGLTLVEVLVVLGVLAFFFFMFISRRTICGAEPGTIQCVYNLKEIGMAARAWASDHGDKYPFDVSQTNGGAMEFASGPNEFKCFQAMSKELSTPKILFCPAEAKRIRQWTTNFATLDNSNLSYFIGLNAIETDPQTLLFGDRNITNGTPIKNGILELTTNTPAGWTAELHKNVHTLVLSDGSVQQVSQTGLRTTLQNTSAFTNRLLMPILSP